MIDSSLCSKEQLWKERLADWEKSGKSAKQWSNERGYAYSTFFFWKRRLKASLKLKDFVEVEIENHKTSSLQLCYQGVQFEIDENFDAHHLARLLATIKQALC